MTDEPFDDPQPRTPPERQVPLSCSEAELVSGVLLRLANNPQLKLADQDYEDLKAELLYWADRIRPVVVGKYGGK